jgi:peptidoglycan/LPS O-acetylase OafA/YrhL
MRLLAPLLVASTVVLFASGVAMGILHGHALDIARQLHGPASVVWMILVGVHVLRYLKRALIGAKDDIAPSSRAAVPGARGRTYLLAFSIVAGVVVGVATLPVDHHWLNLPDKHDNRDGSSALIAHAGR